VINEKIRALVIEYKINNRKRLWALTVPTTLKPELKI
jgi:hypothetical protein